MISLRSACSATGAGAGSLTGWTSPPTRNGIPVLGSAAGLIGETLLISVFAGVAGAPMARTAGSHGPPAAATSRGCYAAPSLFPDSAEQAQDVRRRRVGDRERLDAQLLLGLQRLELGAFLGEVGVDEVAHGGVQGVLQLADEGGVAVERLGTGAELGQ